MYFLIASGLIAEKSPIDESDMPARPVASSLPLRLALSLKWIDSKLANSRLSPARRLRTVFADLHQTRVRADVIATGISGDDVDRIGNIIKAMGREHALFMMDKRPIGSLISGIADILDDRGTAALILFTTAGHKVYPAAAYLSRGNHLYLFFPGIGELKPIKSRNFKHLDRMGIVSDSSDPLDVFYAYIATTMTVRPISEEDYVEMSAAYEIPRHNLQKPIQVYDKLAPIYEVMGPGTGSRALYDTLAPRLPPRPRLKLRSPER